MAVAFDSVVAAPTTSVTTNPVSFTHTASASGVLSGYLVVVAHVRATSPTISCTIGGASASLLGSASDGSGTSVQVFGLAVGTVGASGTIAVSIANSGTVGIRAGSLLYSGVDQSTSTSNPTAQGSLTTSPNTTTAISCSAGSYLLSLFNGTGSSVSPTATISTGTGTLTQRWSGRGGSGQATMSEGAYDLAESTAESASFSWTSSTTAHCLFTILVLPISGVSLSPSAASNSSASATVTAPVAIFPTVASVSAATDALNASIKLLPAASSISSTSTVVRAAVGLSPQALALSSAQGLTTAKVFLDPSVLSVSYAAASVTIAGVAISASSAAVSSATADVEFPSPYFAPPEDLPKAFHLAGVATALSIGTASVALVMPSGATFTVKPGDTGTLAVKEYRVDLDVSDPGNTLAMDDAVVESALDG